MNFKQLGILLFSVILFFGCASSLDRAMKSDDKDLIIETAKKYYDKGKYDEAVLLYEKVGTYLSTVEETKNVTFLTAKANMGAENFLTASHQFSVYNTNYPNSPMAEEALFLSAICLYNLSSDYNLDPTNTQKAIDKFQVFANAYPDSEKVADANKKIDELRQKLEKKSFENAMLYYKINNFKSSSVVLKNFLDEFPDTKKKEDVMYFIFLSDYNLSIKSVAEKKDERIKEALFSYKKFSSTFPQSKYLDEVSNLKNKLIEEQKQLIPL